MIPYFNNSGPCFELFSAATDVTKYWKTKGKFSKEFEPHTKSYIYYLHFGGVSSISSPIDERRSLQINNSCLLFQFIVFNNKSFSIEVCVRDKTDTKRRFNITTSIKEIESKSLYIKIPFINYPMNIWTNLLIDFSSLVQHYFKTQSFKTIESIHVTGNLKIRKIYSLRTKEEPIIKSIDMGKSIPLVNLLLSENGSVINANIKIAGMNHVNVNTVNIDSKSIQNKTNKKKGSPSPPPVPSNHNKYSTTSDIMVNRHKQIYSKRNIKEQNNSKNKMDENRQFIGQLKGLPKAPKLVDDMKYKNGQNAFKKFMNNININEEESNSNNFNSSNNNNNINNNSNNNTMKNNFVDKKSLGKYMQSQKNKKRNKSNNPLVRPKLNKKTEKSEIREEKLEKPEKKIININTNPKIQNKKVEKNNNTKDKNKEINIELNNNNNYNININYHNVKEKEIILEDYSPDSKAENKFKFNNIPLGNSLLNNNNKIKTKEEEKESNIIPDKNPTNKFSNTNMLLESGLDIKNIPIYDSIEEVAEWQGGDWNTAQEKGVGDKLIRLDNTKKIEKNNNNINIDDEDILEFGNLEKKETYRPYTPPIEELVQVNPNKMKGDSNMKVSLDKKNSLKSTKTFKNYENLIYIEEKGLLFDPLTNKYYDIKAK